MQIVKTLCDRAHAKGDEIPADHEGVVLVLNRRAVEMDLSGEALEELQGFLEPWFEIGRRPGKPNTPVTSPGGKSRPRRTFTNEFMAEIAQKCINSKDQSVGQIAAEMDLTETAVRRWITEYQAGRLAAPAAPAPRRPTRQGGERDGLVFCRYHEGTDECMRGFEVPQGRSMHERKAHEYFFNQLPEEEQAKRSRAHMRKVKALVSA